MLRWLALFGLIGVVIAGVAVFLHGGLPEVVGPPEGSPAAAKERPAVKQALAAEPETPAIPAAEAAEGEPVATPLVVVPEGRLTARDVEQVPAMREGQILFLATKVEPGEPMIPGREEDYFEAEIAGLYLETDQPRAGNVDPREFLNFTPGEGRLPRFYSPLLKGDPVKAGKVRLETRRLKFRRLRDGDEMRKGQLLAVLNPSLAVADLQIKLAKLDAAQADFNASEKTRDESEQRWVTAQKLKARGVIAEEEFRGAKLTFDRYYYEAISKNEAINVAAKELRQAETIVDFHAIRSDITGIVKSNGLLKHAGESVRNLDPVMMLQDSRKLLIEGRVGVQDRSHLKKGARVSVEPTQRVSPDRTLIGHMDAVTGVAVTKDGAVVSASDDHSVRVWNRKNGRELMILWHPVGVRAVACSPAANLCLSGATDGVARLWNLDEKKPAPRDLSDGHRGAINGVAFSPDGKWCATGGEDRAICLWDVAEGRLLHRIAPSQGHRGGVTSVAFLPGEKEGELFLVTVGRGDNTLLVWPLGSDGAPGRPTSLGHRGGDVAVLGVNPVGRQVLFDQGQELRIRTVPGGALAGVLKSGGASNFSTLALFSPDGNLILTAGGSDGRLQLWRAPTAKTRGYELRHFAWSGDQTQTSCGAFAPDGSFAVTGTHDRAVLVWPLPRKQEVETQYSARLVDVGQEVDPSSHQVSVQAELDNRWFEVTDRALALLKADLATDPVVKAVADRLAELKGKEFVSEKDFTAALEKLFPPDYLAKYQEAIVQHAEKVGPLLAGNTAAIVVYPK
jgi:WD40 repeat protein